MSSFTNWTMIAVFSFMIVLILGVIIGQYNTDYNKEYTIGLDTSQLDGFKEVQDTMQDNVNGGDIVTTDNGVTIPQTIGIIKDVMGLVWSFISGGWIFNIINMINLGEAGVYLAIGLQIFYFIAVCLLFLFIIFKVPL